MELLFKGSLPHAVDHQDDVPGLQVKLGGVWCDVPPTPGAFICNLGDLLQRW